VSKDGEGLGLSVLLAQFVHMALDWWIGTQEEHRSFGEGFLLMGLSSSLRILVVSHTLPDEDTNRIISAREATRSEKRQYVERLGK
jgi:uncharacterized DUF497 family protein